MRMIAIQPFTYAGKPLKINEQFDAPLEHARIFKESGKAEAAPIEDEAPPRTKRKYNRRDMRAKE